MACGIFLYQGSNPCLLRWQADSLPLNHLGSPARQILNLNHQGSLLPFFFMSNSFKLYSTFLANLFFFLSFSLQSLEWDSCLTKHFSLPWGLPTPRSQSPLFLCVSPQLATFSFLNCSPLLVSVTCSLWDFILSLQVLLVCLVCWLFFSLLFKVQLSPKAQFLALLNSHFSLYDLLFSLGFHHRPFTLMICSYKYMPLSLPPIPKARIVSASILQCSALFIVQLSHPYMTTGKTIALNRWMFFGQIMSLLFNMLCRFSFHLTDFYLLLNEAEHVKHPDHFLGDLSNTLLFL